jgi:hypothetical protein
VATTTHSLVDRVKATNSDLHLSVTEDRWVTEDFDPNELGTQASSNKYLARMLRENDLVVLATVDRQLSLFNDSENKIVTDSLLSIDAILAKGPKIKETPGDKVVVSRLGGRMHVDGHIVTMDVNGFQGFITGKRYLLFLQEDPKTRSFIVQREGALLIDGNSLHPLATAIKHPAQPYLDDASHLFQVIRDKALEVAR